MKKGNNPLRNKKRHVPTLRLLSMKNSIDYEIMLLYDKLKHCHNKNIDYSDYIQIDEEHLFEIIHYILKKATKNQYDIGVMTFYLSKYSSLTSILKHKKDQITTDQMYHKLSLFLQIEFYTPNKILCISGWKGKKFYMILKGLVAILIPCSYTIELTVDEYLKHLNRLKQYKEYDIIKRTNDSNHYSYMHLYMIDEATSGDNQRSYGNEQGENGSDDNEEEGEECSIDQYINRLIPIHKEIDNRRDHLYYNRNGNSNSDELYKAEIIRRSTKTFTLWKYMKICELKTGDSFGDIALKEENNLRTATIITIGDSFFGTLTRDAYNICLRDAQEKIRKIKLNNVLSNQLFNGFYPKVFEKYYFNYFKSVEFNRGNMIFNQGDLRKEIYFLIDGEIRLTTKSSLSHFGDIIESLGGGKCDDRLFIQRKKALYPDLIKFYQRVKEFRIYGIKQKEIFGLDDCIMPQYTNDDSNHLMTGDNTINGTLVFGKDIYFCSACVMSHRCELYAIEVDLFKKILLNENSVRISNINLQKERRKMMVNRLMSIKDITIQSYCHYVKNDIENSNKIDKSDVSIRNAPYNLRLEYSMSIDNAKSSFMQNSNRSKENHIEGRNYHNHNEEDDQLHPMKTQPNLPSKHSGLFSFDKASPNGIMITTSSFLPNRNIMKKLMMKEEEKNKETSGNIISKSSINFTKEIRKFYPPSLQYQTKTKLLQKDIIMYNNVVDKLVNSFPSIRRNEGSGNGIEGKTQNQYTQYQNLHHIHKEQYSNEEKADITSIDCLIFDKYIEKVEDKASLSHKTKLIPAHSLQKYYKYQINNKNKHKRKHKKLKNHLIKTQGQSSSPYLHHYPIPVLEPDIS